MTAIFLDAALRDIPAETLQRRIENFQIHRRALDQNEQAAIVARWKELNPDHSDSALQD